MRSLGLLALVALGGCTETLVVDATGEEVPSTQVFAAPPANAPRDPAREALGRVVLVQTPTTTNRFHFLQGSILRIENESGKLMVTGSYYGKSQSVCLRWAPRGEECWPRPAILGTRTAQQVTSDRGQTITVTWLPE